MRNTLKRILPTSVLNVARRTVDSIRTSLDFRADRRRYQRYASAGDSVWPRMTDRQIEAQLTKDYHRVEKGMALPTPKRPFGADVQARLDALLDSGKVVDPGSVFAVAARDAQLALRTWNSGGSLDDEVAPPIVEHPGTNTRDPQGFFSSRHSVRNYTSKSPSHSLLREATSLAISSPSVCNRQPWIVRYFSGDEVPAVLAHQNGNRGFRENVPALAVISVDVAMFGGTIERNQAWIEGGIFGSSLVWALHSLGLASCMLNLSMTTRSADGLRHFTGMSDSEVPIMMVAIGYAAPEYRRARSSRRDPSDVAVRLATDQTGDADHGEGTVR